ncbi:T9SS type A sorting domain-containing protein [bacterium]|nr:T9SS type A sorting domain-containing protein [bacterium]
MNQWIQAFTRIFFPFTLLLAATSLTFAEWSLLPGPSSSSPVNMTASSSLLLMPDSSLVLIVLDQGEPTPAFHLKRFDMNGDLLNEGISPLSSLDLEPPIQTAVIDTTVFAVGINATVNPPSGHGQDILIRTFDLAFDQVGSLLIIHEGDDSLSAMIGLGSSHVAMTGVLDGPEGRAFVQTVSVDGLLDWGWEDTLSSHLTSRGLDMLWDPVHGFVTLLRFTTALEQKVALVRMGTPVEWIYMNPDHQFPFRKGKMILGGVYDSSIYYCGFDPIGDASGYIIGSYDNRMDYGWETEGEANAGNLSLLPRFGMVHAEGVLNVLVVSDQPAPGWSDQYIVEIEWTPPSDMQTFEIGGNAVLSTPTNGAVLLGSSITRIGRDGSSYYTVPLDGEAVEGVRLNDSVFVALMREETTPDHFTHTLQWYTEHFENLPPDAPVPLEPENGGIVDLQEDFWAAMRWRTPNDPDPETEVETQVVLQVQRFQRPDTLFTISGLPDTSLVIRFLDNNAGVPLDHIQGAIWTLRFISQGDTVEMDEPWSFTIQSTAVAETPLPVSFAFDLYPNPFNSSARVRISLPEPTNLRVSLVNMLGQEVFSQPFHRYAAGTHTLSLNPSLSSGVYLLRIQDDSGHTLAAHRAILIQ